ncbi:hypothetical protein AMTRI_Chr03g45630 [Amborella trichopoda]|nr:zinc finger AN1 and C2H2 domain-containing stress-associated protein 16 [Amborella trichopoda]XP_011621429.1 zinc finger AN1 and C2H2 domain-containing stress-associated protein 16 [Amborella trichopoda]XP_020519749.1 zinc finger AN1 and C2H2 domain-containing stress-associated protein 16 [Amborella trichopoda]XP_020519750.1 zinc finger AN1 and C2H2 domain-containing stress-associated protein 16 [Amborella trichopoda]|eukprot:XP_011621428.1 zinc finger AN1 and C2H2 domain-containing stress-associated protein 16 [Amborella trichopoda]
MGTPEFPNLGRHCSVDDCRLIDFLPFTCDRCDQVLCLEHRSYSKHHCSGPNKDDVTVLVCPLCAKGVRLDPEEDPNITWESHVRTDCDPSNYQKATKKPRCPVPGCKETLVFSNTIRCKDCNRDHCLKHRFGLDHKCPGPKKPEPSFSFSGFLRGQKNEPSGPKWAWKTETTGSRRAQPQVPWGPSLLSAASSMRASAESSFAKLSIATSEALQKAKEGAMASWEAKGQGSGALAEKCRQCGAQFGDVADLINHVERVHEGPMNNGEAIDVCPKCQRGFRDPVLLVEHVEKDHRGSSRS